MYEIRHYLEHDGRDPFAEWRHRLRDTSARIAIDRRIMRLELGNHGDHKSVGDGVWELRVDAGPGYRIYYAQAGAKVVLLLCGGDKRKQATDIKRAVAYWRDWQQRSEAGV
jgi:putative addiction module killer protein